MAGVAASGAAVWTAVVALPDQVAYRGIGLAPAVDRTGEVFRQSVGLLGSLDVPLPALVVAIWAVGVVAAVLGAALTARRKHVGPLLALTALALILSR